MHRFAVLLALILIQLNVSGQFTIKGRVVDSISMEPLAGSKISLLDTYLTTATDAKGNFILRNVKAGYYNLNVSFLGYEPRNILLDLSKDVDISMQLSVKAILAQEVEVQSTRAGGKTPVTYENIGFNTIHSQNLGQDMPMLLSNSISAVSSSDAGNSIGYSSLRIRGSDMTRINVTINGIPLNDPESHNVFWVDLPDFAASTDNIQIQRGVGTSTSGAASFGASINLQSTAIKSETYAEISSSFGSYRTSRNALSFGTGLIKKHWSLDGRISALASDGYIDRASSQLQSYFISGAYSNKKSILRLNLISGKEKTYQAWDGIPTEILDTNRTYNGMGLYVDNHGNRHFYTNETDNYKQSHIQALYSLQPFPSLLLNAALHYTKGAGYYEQYRDDDDFDHYGMDAFKLPLPYYLQGNDTIPEPDSLVTSCDLIRRKQLDNDFAGITYSLTWQKNKVSATLGGSWNTYLGRHFGRLIWSQYSSDTLLNYEWYRSKANKKDFNIYTKLNYDYSSGINLFLDLQLRQINYVTSGNDDNLRNFDLDKPYLFINPKAGAYFTINSSHSAYFSIAVANREPNRDNFVDANPSKVTPKPETLYDFEMGHRYATHKLSIHSNIFLMLYHDQLILTGAINDVGAPVMENVPQSYRMGLEFSSQLHLFQSLHWNFHATVSKNKIRSFTEYIDNWDTWEQILTNHQNTDIAFSPELTAGNELRWNFIENGSLTLISRYVGKQFIDNTMDENRMLKSYMVNDITMSYTFHLKMIKAIDCTFRLNNLLNKQYESNAWVYRYYSGGSYSKMDGYFPQAGINFLVGFSLHF